MKPKFREDKTTQAACLLLRLRGGTMSYMKLIKLLYLADRQALARWGRPISFDSYFSLDKGPVLSTTLNLITEGSRPATESYWGHFISAPCNYEVRLEVDECPLDALSPAEREVLEGVFAEFGAMSRWDLVDWMHENLPEWTDPEGSAIRVSYHDILRSVGKTDLEAAEIEAELESLALADVIFQ